MPESRRNKALVCATAVVAALAIAFISLSSAYELAYEEHVLVFEEYNIHVVLDENDAAHVDLTAVIRNNVENPVVPGYLTLVTHGYEYEKFLIFTSPFSEGKPVPLDIENVKGYVDGKEIRADVNKAPVKGVTVINLEGLWEPITQGEKRTVRVTFDIPNAVDGVLFKEGKIPVGYLGNNLHTYSLPIDSQTVTLEVPGPVTYADVNANVQGNMIIWHDTNLRSGDSKVYEFEYTTLPAFPRLGFRGYWLFWILIFALVILIAYMYTRFTKQRKEDQAEASSIAVASVSAPVVVKAKKSAKKPVKKARKTPSISKK